MRCRASLNPAVRLDLTMTAARTATIQRNTKETRIRVERQPRRHRRAEAGDRDRLLRPHARPDRAPRAGRPRDRGQGRPAHRRPPHRRGRRHHVRPGGRQGGRRQEGPAPLRPRLRAARRGAVARRDRFFRAARARDARDVQGRHDRRRSTSSWRTSSSRASPTTRWSRCTSTTCAATTRTTSARRCSRRSRARCAWRVEIDPRAAARCRRPRARCSATRRAVR